MQKSKDAFEEDGNPLFFNVLKVLAIMGLVLQVAPADAAAREASAQLAAQDRPGHNSASHDGLQPIMAVEPPALIRSGCQN